MGFQVGAFRFDRSHYNAYTLTFKDISGVTRKADVKIAGVKVGWVEQVALISGEYMSAQADVMVSRDYTLYADAHGMVRQDGLLGPKYIEIVPGDPMLPTLDPGNSLARPSTETVSVDELMQQFKQIAANVEDVTDTFKGAIGGPEGREQLKSIVCNLDSTVKQLSSFSSVLDRSFMRNEDNIDAILEMGNHVRRLSEKIENNILPSFQESVEKISNVFDRDFNRIATQLEATAESVEDASLQARDGLRSISSVAEKIDEGKGLIGKLINEDETYRDLKVAVQGFKNYLTKVDRLQIVFDSHFEAMHRQAENYLYEDSKGYFDMRIHPSEDHFYLVQLVSSEKGWVDRKEIHRSYLDKPLDRRSDPTIINPRDDQFTGDQADLVSFREYRDFFREEISTFNRNTLKFGLQFGKIFKDIALRAGLFEGTAGVGIDIDVPFRTDKFRWVTTLELFDMRGWNRLNDRRPHVKWLNRMFIFRNIYFTFGADDFISKRNASAFFGAGLRFGDDDIKYLFSSLGSGSSFACQ